jgi:hypothetical protein
MSTSKLNVHLIVLGGVSLDIPTLSPHHQTLVFSRNLKIALAAIRRYCFT